MSTSSINKYKNSPIDFRAVEVMRHGPTGVTAEVIGMTEVPSSNSGEQRKFRLRVTRGPHLNPSRFVGEVWVQSGRQLDDLWYPVSNNKSR